MFTFFETGKVYICGGFNGTECLNSTETYDTESNQWTLVSPMNNSRSGLGVIAYKGDVYALGGFNGIARMCSAERYCPKSNKWRTIADMGGPRSNFAVEVTGFLSLTPPPLSKIAGLDLSSFRVFYPTGSRRNDFHSWRIQRCNDHLQCRVLQWIIG